MGQRKKQRVLGRYIERSIALGLALLIPSVGCLVAAALTSGALGVVLGSIGSALGTVALLSLLYDAFLRDQLATEIIERVGLRDSIARSGLRDTGPARNFRPKDFVSRSSKCRIVPLVAAEWVPYEFRELVSGIDAATAVEVYIPSPEPLDPQIGIIADRLGADRDALSRRLRHLPDEIAAAWDATGHHPNARLSVYFYTGVPSSGLLECDSAAIYEVGPSVAFAPADRATTSLVFDPDSPGHNWIRSQIDELAAVASVAALRPVTAPGDLPREAFLAVPPSSADEALAVEERNLDGSGEDA